MWFNILLLFMFGHIILQTNAVNMCSNETAGSSTASNGVTLNLVNGTGENGCNCTVKLNNAAKLGSNKPKIFFKRVKFSGCRYQLVISYNNIIPTFRCDRKPTEIFFDINATDEIQLYLKSSSQDGTEFAVEITSSVTGTTVKPLIKLECFLPNITSDKPSNMTTPTVSNNTTTTIMNPGGNTSSQHTIYILTSPESTSSSEPTTNAFSSSTASERSTKNSIINNENKVAKEKNNNDLDIGLIGGSVGGALLLIFVVIGIIFCIVSHRKKKNRDKKDYNRPGPRVSEHGYTDINLPAENNNSSPDGINNASSTRANSAPPKQPDNTKKTKNDPNQMIIIENDLYVSSDDLFDSKPRNGNANNPETSNGPPKMEIIENDLYVSSDDVLNSQSNDEKAPVYAVVHKKPKPPTSVKDASSKDVAQNDQNTML